MVVAKVILVVILFCFLATYVPLALIWALNTLFNLTIAYSFTNWCASLILLLIVGAK